MMKHLSSTPWFQDVNWTYIRRSEDVQGMPWTSYVRSIYVLRLRGSKYISKYIFAMFLKVIKNICIIWKYIFTTYKLKYILKGL